MAQDDRSSLKTDGLITKGILLGYSASGVTPSVTAAGAAGTSTTLIKGLQQIPDIGGTAETIEVTTFNDHAHTYINGLLNYGDSIDFTCLHDSDQFIAVNGLQGQYNWIVALPDGATHSSASDFATIKTVAVFPGEVSAKVNGVGTNEALTDTISLKPSGTIEFSQLS